jgi:hypothetical protein
MTPTDKAELLVVVLRGDLEVLERLLNFGDEEKIQGFLDIWFNGAGASSRRAIIDFNDTHD